MEKLKGKFKGKLWEDPGNTSRFSSVQFSSINIVSIRRNVKPGSHMPPKYLRHGRWYCLRYFSDMRTQRRRQQETSQSLPPACLRVQLRRHAGGKD